MVLEFSKSLWPENMDLGFSRQVKKKSRELQNEKPWQDLKNKFKQQTEKK